MPRFDAEDLGDDREPTGSRNRPQRSLAVWVIPLLVGAGVLLTLGVMGVFLVSTRQAAMAEREAVQVMRVEEARHAEAHRGLVDAAREGKAVPDSEATADELANLYRTDPAGASTKFTGKRVRVKNVVIDELLPNPGGSYAVSRAYGGANGERVRLVFFFRDDFAVQGRVGPGPVAALDARCAGKTPIRPPGGAPEADAYIVFDTATVP